jgi:hypothetical protein
VESNPEPGFCNKIWRTAWRDGYREEWTNNINRFILLYSGKYFKRGEKQYLCNQIFIFDWDGNPQNNYLLDIPRFNFVVDERQKKYMELQMIRNFE